MPEGDYYDGMKLILRLAAFIFPPLIIGVALIQIFFHRFAVNYIATGVLLTFGACYAARFLFRRSKNEEAVFFLTRIKASNAQGFEYIGDSLVIVFEVGLLFFAIFQSYL